jgi:hypothetical protein
MMADLDSNGDNEVSFEEFEAWWRINGGKAATVRALPGRLGALSVSIVSILYGVYGRAGRLTALFGRFWRGQKRKAAGEIDLKTLRDIQGVGTTQITLVGADRNYSLEAETPEEAEVWLAKLRSSVCPLLHVYGYLKVSTKRCKRY